MVCIYVLQLTQRKYYVGKTWDINSNNITSCEWTNLYTPVKLIKVVHNCEHLDEDIWTLRYMRIHGIENVRGGCYSDVKITDSMYLTLLELIFGKPIITSKVIPENNTYEHIIKSKKTYKSDILYKSFCNQCYICGRYGHVTTNCVEHKHYKGFYIKRE